MNAARFVIDDRPEPARSQPARAAFAPHVVRWLSWIELLLLMPSRLLGAVGWLAVPLLLVVVLPVVLLAVLMLVQAPVFFVLWKLFGGEPLGDAPAE